MSFWEDSTMTTQKIAQELLGCLLIHDTPDGITSGYIVETEAYLGEVDKAAHSYQRRNTPRLASMYKAAGTIYVYQMHTQNLLNLVVKEKGIPEAILIRALEPAQGLDLMRARRVRNGIELTNGPGKLSQAMGISKENDGKDISQPPLYLSPNMKKTPQIISVSERIGIPNKDEWTTAPLRYTVEGNPFVSRSRKSDAQSDGGWLVHDE